MHKPFNDSPGPHANYNFKPGFGGVVGANRFSFTGKPRAIGTYMDQTPGPDVHGGQRSSLGGIKQTFGARPIEVPGGNHVPGPGKYDVDVAFNRTRSKGQSYSLTGRPANPTLGMQVPGPGQYSVIEAYEKSNVKGPSYSMLGKTRRVDLNDQIPGPAAYNHELKMGGVAFSFTGKYRPPTSSDDGPGPGKYYKESKLGGAAWSLAKRYPQFDTTFAYTELAKEMMLKGYNNSG